MTQQLDLAFNTTNTTDKMMSNTTTSSFSTKDNKEELSTQFGNFLDNTVSYKSNDKKDLKANEKEKSYDNVQEKQHLLSYDEETPSSENTVVLKDEINLSENKVIVQEQLVQNEEFQNNMDELLQDSLLVAILSDTIQMINTDNIKPEIQSLVLDFSSDNELPAEAIKSGIKFETVLTSVDTDNANIAAVDNLTKDMTVSKDDLISQMYDVKSEGTIQPETISDAADVVEDTTAIPVAEQPKSEMKEETVTLSVKKDEKEAENIVSTEKIKPEIKTEVKNVELLQEEQTVEVNEAPVAISVGEPEFDFKEISVPENKYEKTEKNDEQPKQQNEPVVKNAETKNVEQTLELNIAAVQQEVKTAEPQTKTEELKQEIASAKLENAVNNVPTKTENKTPVENAKTNVDAEETIDIKDDVKGIEFVNNKFEEKTQEIIQDKTQEKHPVAEMHTEKVKQRVENVKMQVEENVKINPQIQKEAQDVNKVANANETLEKAGLSTENLRKMDAKIKEIDNSNSKSGADLGQSSKEMIMRDMMQNNTSTAETVELKVDFNQSLNNKLQQTNLTQTQQPQDIQEVNILDQIRAKFALNSQNGMQKITIGLTPESLGKLNIEITKGQNGISAQILADNPQAKEILDKNLDGLKSVLQSQGVNVNNVNVKVAEAGRSSDSNNNMFNQDDSQFNSNNSGGNSKNSDDTEREKRSEYEFLQKEALKTEIVDEPEEVVERATQMEKTVSIKGGLGNVSYKL